MAQRLRQWAEASWLERAEARAAAWTPLRTLEAEHEGDLARIAALEAARDVDQARIAALTAERETDQARIAALTAERETDQARIAALTAERETDQARIAALTAERETDQARIAVLEARLGQNSHNSSKPPSTDPPGTPPRPRRMKSRGRKPGGQPGHAYHGRERLPPEQVTEVVVVEPAECAHCHGPFDDQDRRSQPQVHQVIDIPPITPQVIEYRLVGCLCSRCQQWTAAELPPGVPSRGEGPRLTALVALLCGKYRLAKRPVREVLRDVLGIELSLGTVCNLCEEMSEALADPVAEARESVRRAWLAFLDETGWKQGQADGRKLRAWLWVAATTTVAVFRIATSRGAQVAQEILGEHFAGTIVTDRWSAYSWIDANRRQLCWSHLLRDFQGFVDRGGRGGEIGAALLQQADLMFQWWHRVRDGTLDRVLFQLWMAPVETEILRLLRLAAALDRSKTAGMAHQILKLEPALFTFVRVEGVEPTNNHGERTIRPGAMWRRTSFGTQSEAGSRFVERILTAVTTLRLQKRDVLEFLTAAHAARLEGKPAPSLLPKST